GQHAERDAVCDDVVVGAAFARQLLGKAAFLADRGKLARQFDGHQRIGEASERFSTVEPPGDEQERHARGKAQEEAEEVRPPALGQGGYIAAVMFFAQRACPSARSGLASSSETILPAGAPWRIRFTASAIGMAMPSRC